MSLNTIQSSDSKDRLADEPFSDASSSYWPEGWNWARFSDPDTNIMALPEDERMKMSTGLKEVLGEEGMRRMGIYRRRKWQKREDQKLRDQGVPPPKYHEPNFLKLSRKGCINGHPWGFVAFRTALYDNEERWIEFKSRVQQILNVAFDLVVEGHRGHEYEEVAIARKLFTLHWIEDKELDGATEKTLREWYLNVKKEAPMGMDYDMFLCASPEAVESVFSNPLPTTESYNWRDDAPFLLVVMEEVEVNPHGDEPHDPEDPHDERNWYKSVFKVPVEIVPSELWETTDRAIWPASRLMRAVKGCNQLLGGPAPRNLESACVDGLNELWWGMGSSPQAIRRRALLRGFSQPWF
ncbi:hypothetical protein FQN49_002433 [Arthroderma sp. PD_2]|nr:hypothetical protein FQN49_002433 [Arthroderma sp. PD_2]